MKLNDQSTEKILLLVDLEILVLYFTLLFFFCTFIKDWNDMRMTICLNLHFSVYYLFKSLRENLLQ